MSQSTTIGGSWPSTKPEETRSRMIEFLQRLETISPENPDTGVLDTILKKYLVHFPFTQDEKCGVVPLCKDTDESGTELYLLPRILRCPSFGHAEFKAHVYVKHEPVLAARNLKVVGNSLCPIFGDFAVLPLGYLVADKEAKMYTEWIVALGQDKMIWLLKDKGYDLHREDDWPTVQDPDHGLFGPPVDHHAFHKGWKRIIRLKSVIGLAGAGSQEFVTPRRCDMFSGRWKTTKWPADDTHTE